MVPRSLQFLVPAEDVCPIGGQNDTDDQDEAAAAAVVDRFPHFEVVSVIADTTSTQTMNFGELLGIYKKPVMAGMATAEEVGAWIGAWMVVRIILLVTHIHYHATHSYTYTPNIIQNNTIILMFNLPAYHTGNT